MAKRSIKRNGRGQIVSYETDGGNYGEVSLSSTNSQEIQKYNLTSFRNNVDSEIVEFAVNPEYQSSKKEIQINLPGILKKNIKIETTTEALVKGNPQIDLGFIATMDIPTQVGSNDQSSGTGGS